MGGRAAAAHNCSQLKPRPFTEAYARRPGPFLRTRSLRQRLLSSPRQSFWVPRQTGATTGEKRTITTVVCLYGKLYLAFVAPSGDLLYTLLIFIKKIKLKHNLHLVYYHDVGYNRPACKPTPPFLRIAPRFNCNIFQYQTEATFH